MFYQIRQNNSVGSFRPPAKCVVIEAGSRDEACQRTSPHFSLCEDTGRYADYDECGCCPCCGHRWSPPWDEAPEDSKSLIDSIKNQGVTYMGTTATALIKSDGSITIADSPERLEEICQYIEKATTIQQNL